jgi:hypothetical protein
MNGTTHTAASSPILLGSTFPLSLVRRQVSIDPASLDELRAEVAVRPVASFWGHANSIAAANAMLGADVTPSTTRPALILDPEGFPSLDGVIFTECWVLSPEYVPGYRPAVGEEVAAVKIAGWQVLRMQW